MSRKRNKRGEAGKAKLKRGEEEKAISKSQDCLMSHLESLL